VNGVKFGETFQVMLMAIPSEAQISLGTCRDLTAPTYVCENKYGEEKVQRTNILKDGSENCSVMKIPRWQHRAGSIPALGTIFIAKAVLRT